MEELKSNHRQLMRELISGKRVKDAARACGMSARQASAVKNSELFQVEMERMQARIDNLFVEEEVGASVAQHRERLRRLVPAALDAIEDRVRDGENPSQQLMSAKEILDRSGMQTVERSEVEVKVDAGDNLFSLLQTVREDLRRE